MQLAMLIHFSVSMFVFGIVSIEVWKSQLPVWGFVLALCISAYDPLVIFLCANIPVLSIRVRHTRRHDPGHNEPASWAKRHHRAYHRIRHPRPPDCDDAVQNLGLYLHDSSTSIHQ